MAYPGNVPVYVVELIDQNGGRHAPPLLVSKLTNKSALAAAVMDKFSKLNEQLGEARQNREQLEQSADELSRVREDIARLDKRVLQASSDLCNTNRKGYNEDKGGEHFEYLLACGETHLLQSVS